MYSAMVGKATAVLFVLSYDDFKQLSATYVDDGSKITESLIVRNSFWSSYFLIPYYCQWVLGGGGSRDKTMLFSACRGQQGTGTK